MHHLHKSALEESNDIRDRCRSALHDQEIKLEKYKSIKIDAPGFLEFFEINELKAQIQDKNMVISELKKLIEMLKRKSVDIKFEKPSVVRQPNVFRFQKPSVLDCTNHPIHRRLWMHKAHLKLMCRLVEKYLGTVQFGNDQFASILGYGDLVQGNIMIKRVYYIEGLNHNLFSGNDLLMGNRGSDLYTISLQETSSPTLIGFMEKASPTQAWLWHRKAKRSTFKTKIVPSSKGMLHLLHMDLCGLMRIESINGKKYIMVIVDDYSRYTLIQRNLQAQVITVRTDRGTEFLNKTLHAYFKEEGIEHQTSIARTPEQYNVVKRRNHTLVEAARTMLTASKLPLFFWAEVIATACYSQHRSLIIPRHEKIPYHIINDRKPTLKDLYIFGCTYYITRDGENLDTMKEKGICAFWWDILHS
ncbi:retrovirus-related pol polyprotein from transposon TNT 1-94 [Tanacetum coccineum]